MYRLSTTTICSEHSSDRDNAAQLISRHRSGQLILSYLPSVSAAIFNRSIYGIWLCQAIATGLARELMRVQLLLALWAEGTSGCYQCIDGWSRAVARQYRLDWARATVSPKYVYIPIASQLVIDTGCKYIPNHTRFGTIATRGTTTQPRG